MSTTAASGAYGALSRSSNVVSSLPDLEAEQRVVPAHGPADDLGVGIQDQLVRVEAMAEVRRVRAVHAVAVQLARMHVRQVAVPDHVGLLGQRNRQRLDFGVDRVEQAELDAGGVLGEQREVDADAVPGGAERIRGAGQTRRCVVGTADLRNTARVRDGNDLRRSVAELRLGSRRTGDE